MTRDRSPFLGLNRSPQRTAKESPVELGSASVRQHSWLRLKRSRGPQPCGPSIAQPRPHGNQPFRDRATLSPASLGIEPR